jgi:hypothetical protein
MAGRTHDNDVGLAPADAPAQGEYERDFYSWLMEQAAHVRAGRWDVLDRENLADEIVLGARTVQQVGKCAARAVDAHAQMGSSAKSAHT